MNHRTGKLTAADFDPSHDAPAASWFNGPIEHSSDFGVVNVGSSFHDPAPERGMNCADDNQGRGPNPPSVSGSEWAWLIVCALLLGWVVLAAVGAST